MESTNSLHKDNRQTVILIDGKLYELVLSDLTLDDIKEIEDINKRPHVRILGSIPNRTPQQQIEYNKESQLLHDLASQARGKRKKSITIEKIVSNGESVPQVILDLLEKKKKASQEESKKIRKQLRKLNYKRYINQGGGE